MKFYKVKMDDNSNGQDYLFHCPGCDYVHRVTADRAEHPVWTFNGDVNRPTISPSYLIQIAAVEQWPEIRCHSYIRDGRIEFLSDCSHALRGQTVELPDWE